MPRRVCVCKRVCERKNFDPKPKAPRFPPTPTHLSPNIKPNSPRSPDSRPPQPTCHPRPRGQARQPRVEAAERVVGAPQRRVEVQGQAVVGEGVLGAVRLVAEPPEEEEPRGALRDLGRLVCSGEVGGDG